MNPVITLSKNLITFALDAKDKAKLAATTLVAGAAGTEEQRQHHMCVMQATSMVTTQSHFDLGTERYADDPICVSEALTGALIEANDTIRDKGLRARLKEVIPDILNTCPVVDDRLKNCQRRGTYDEFPAYRLAEADRNKMFRHYHGYSGEQYVGDIDRFLADIRQAADMYRTSDAQSC